MILSTTNSIEGYKIIKYLGIVSAIEVQLTQTKVSFKQQIINDTININISKAKEEAFQKLVKEGNNLKADAIVGINIDIEVNTQMRVIISITGTAVLFK